MIGGYYDTFRDHSNVHDGYYKRKIYTERCKKKIQDYESQYGLDFFVDYYVEEKDTSWGRAYLNELEIKSMTGMTSKQFILHLAEVSEYVHTHEKSEKKNNKQKYIIVGIGAGIIIALVITLLCMSK